MKVFSTKHALTRGIEEVDVRPTLSSDSVIVNGSNEWLGRGAWHADRADAVKAAEHMREQRIKSLKKQLARLEEMRFEN